MFDFKKQIINTHCHHMPDDFFTHMNLDKILQKCYIFWSGEIFGDNRESRKKYLEKVRFKSYFKWLEKSLMDLYQMDEFISVDTWDEYSRRIAKGHRNRNRHLEILSGQCNYKKVILDCYWKPGSDNGHNEIFSPAYRIDPFFNALTPEKKNFDGITFNSSYSIRTNDLRELENFIGETIKKSCKNGVIALKSAIAYERTLDYQSVSFEKAASIFKNAGENPDALEIKLFQDYLFFYFCRIAAENGIPFQIHTGLGQLYKTNPLQLQQVIESNSETKFVLFHGGYPWIDDTMGLLHKYKNVYPDICWLPLLSPKAAEIALHQLIEIGLSDRICWGCDTWTGEESYGAQLAFQFVLNKVLQEKINDNYLTKNDSEIILKNICYENAENLYKL